MNLDFSDDQKLLQEEARKLIHKLEHTKLYDIVKSISVCFDPDDLNTLLEEDE